MSVLSLALLSLAGCSGGSAERYVPKEVHAREALVAVLDAWRTGKPEASISGTPIHVSDTQRRIGQKLRTYEILGELPADSGRRYQVKLMLDNPAAEQKVQYVVVGIDPLWIFRQEDYDMMTHWDHPMPSAAKAAKGGADTGTAAAGAR